MYWFFVITWSNDQKGNRWYAMQYHRDVTLEQVKQDAEVIQVTNGMPLGIVAVFAANDLPEWFKLREGWMW